MLVTRPGLEMLMHQARRSLDFFGLHAAARTVERDMDFIRKQVVAFQF